MKITRIGKKNSAYFRHLTDAVPNDALALGAIEEGRAAGAAVFTLDNGVCILENLRVEEAYRRRGIATGLVDALAETLPERGIDTILTYCDDSEDILGFLAHRGFACAPGDEICSFAIADAVSCAHGLDAMKMKIPPEIRSFREIGNREINRICKGLEQKGYDPELLAGGAYDPEISFACIRGGSPEALILADEQGGNVRVSLLTSFRQQDSRMLYHLMVAFLQAAAKGAAEGARVYYVEQNERITDFIAGFLGDPARILRDGVTWSAVLACETV